jgi:hypothetical protein
MNGDLNLKFESGTAASEFGSIQDDLTEVGEWRIGIRHLKRLGSQRIIN